jgi:hypothetical protein
MNSSVFANSTAVCSAEFLGLHKLTPSEQVKRLTRYEVLEYNNNLLRKMKKNDPKGFELEKHYFDYFKKFDEQLYQGKISYARKEWAGLFRRVERNYFYIKKQQEMFNFLNPLRESNVESAFAELFIKYHNDKFALYILNKMKKRVSSGDLRNVDELQQYLKIRIRSSSQFFGFKFSKYEFINKQMNLIEKSKQCKKHCKEQIKVLRKQLGVNSKAEIEKFDFFKDLPRVKLSEMRSLVNSNPTAREVELFKEILFELREVVNDIFTQPNLRKGFADALMRIQAIRETAWVASRIDRLLTEAHSVAAHYFPIDKIVKRVETTADKFDKLKNQTSIFEEDALLITFARRKDPRAQEIWGELLIHAKENDVSFHLRMEAAAETAKLRADLDFDYPCRWDR